MGYDRNDQGEGEEGGHDEDPETGQDSQGGLVDEPKYGLGHQLHRRLEETYDGEDLPNFFRLHQLGHGGAGGGEDVVVEVVRHDPDDKEGPDLGSKQCLEIEILTDIKKGIPLFSRPLQGILVWPVQWRAQ